jgi:predicted RNA-binding protein with PIN domain
LPILLELAVEQRIVYYSLLHSWPQLAPGKARHSEAAREELIRVLRLYRDATHIPVTIFFDGTGSRGPQTSSDSTPEVEVIYSPAGKTADEMIERAAHRFVPYGEVLAVTDDNAERDTVLSLGGLASSCLNFVGTLEQTLSELEEDVQRHNRDERHRFRRSRYNSG